MSKYVFANYFILTISGLFSVSSFAGPLQVTLDDKTYELNQTKDTLAFDERGFSKKIKKQKCNKALFEQFTADLNSNKKSLIDMPKEDFPAGAIKITFDGKTKTALRLGSEGQYFADLPSKFRNLWLTSDKVCSR